MKKYTILEKESNGKFARMSNYSTRQEATRVLSKIFSNDPNADPQNFKIEEEEIESESKFDQALDKLMKDIKHFTSGFVLGERSTTCDGNECAKLLIGDGIDIWTSTALRAILNSVENRIRFSIAQSPVTGRIEMLLIDNT